MRWLYTKKAEADGFGKAGDVVTQDPGHSLAYMRLHGYVAEAKTSSRRTSTGAVGTPTGTGAMPTPKKEEL